MYGLIEQPHFGWQSPFTLVTLFGGIAALLTFVWHEANTKNAMMPLSLYKIRNFSAGNIATLSIYGGLSIATFLIVIFLQQVGGYSALQAGLALLPITIIMFFLSSRFGALAGKYGPRVFMTAGPVLGGVGFIIISVIGARVQYWTDLLPGILIFALGLSITVAPLTSAVLGDIDKSRAGIASAINNAIARIAGLITIAFAGVIVGQHIHVDGFQRAMLVTALLMFIGGGVSWIGIRNHPQPQTNH